MLKKEGLSSSFADRANPTILIYKKCALKNFPNVTGKNLY